MELMLLGTVEGRHGGDVVNLGRRQERCLLGLLALEAGRLTSIDRLVDLMWDGHPPASARAAVHTYVARLRATLSPYRVRIVTRRDGYLLSTDDLVVDAYRFADLVAGADATADPEARAGGYQRALDLWRGPLLADVASDELRARIDGRLRELRLHAIERRMEALLELGRADAVVAEYAGHVAAHPARERTVAHAVTAYYRLNRQAEALALYDTTRRHLADELGVDPGPELRDLHVKVVRQAPDLAAPAPAAPIPRQLPRDLTDFVGRSAELATLDELVEPGATVTISAIAGMSGIGKTALATRWAHRTADRFPDGQLYLNLRGYDATTPMPAIEALGRLIRALGYRAGAVPDDEQAAGTLYRTLIADKRMLVLLDNARTADQVRPLLPGSASAVVLVTSRDTLGGLIARDGARFCRLDVLSPVESVELLRRMLGARRVDAESEAAAALAALVGHLPLALRILAAQLVTAPGRSIADLLGSLAGERLVGQIAVAGDEQASVQLAFDSSYGAVTPAQQRLLRLLGAAPGGDITVEGAAALLDVDPDEARDLLYELVTAHLVIDSGGRYGMHDLVRDYACVRALDVDADGARAAVDRLTDWYIDHASSATTALFGSVELLPRQPRYVVATPFDEATARAFLDAEVGNLLAALRVTDPGRYLVLSNAIRNYLWLCDHPTGEQLEIFTIAVAHADESGDPRERAAAHWALGSAQRETYRCDEAIVELERAVEFARACGWLATELAAAAEIANCYFNLGRFAEASVLQERNARAKQAAGRLVPAAVSLANQGNALQRLGRLRDASAAFHEALEIGAGLSPAWLVLLIQQNLAVVQHLLGDYDAALATLNEVLAHHATQGQSDSDSEGHAYDTLAAVYRDQGRLDLALPAATRAVDLLRSRATTSVALALNTLGSVAHSMGRVDEATDHYHRALALAREQQSPAPEVEALLGLARVDLGRGDAAPVVTRAGRALSIARERQLTLAEGDALLVLAEVALAQGDQDNAARDAAGALELHAAADHRLGVARAEAVLARADDGKRMVSGRVHA